MTGGVTPHEAHGWVQIGPCVYCKDCRVRLYEGELPTERRPLCDEHEWDVETGVGFYQQCRNCGAIEWFE